MRIVSNRELILVNRVEDKIISYESVDLKKVVFFPKAS